MKRYRIKVEEPLKGLLCEEINRSVGNEMEPVMICVRLLEVPQVGTWKVGDVTVGYPYELEEE